MSEDLPDFIQCTLFRVGLLICHLGRLLNELVEVSHPQVVKQERFHGLVIRILQFH